MSDKPVVGSIVFNPAPDAAGPSINPHTQTVMIGYGGSTPQQMLERIATLERELAEAKAREERLRVQLEVLSDACRAVDRYEAERDPRWIAVLQQKGDTNADA